MTIIASASLTPTTGAEAIYNLKQLLVGAGWVVVSSSNGSSLSAGDIITSGSVLANANAYFIVKQPLGATGSYGGVRRELGFQRTTGNTVWRVQYLHTSSSVSGGTASVMASGSADERRYILGDGSAGQTIMATDNSYRWHCIADNAAPYGFWAAGYQVGGSTPDTVLLMDPMVSGSFVSNDNDPYVFYFARTNAMLQNNNAANGLNQIVTSSIRQSPQCWLAKGLTGEIWTGIGVPALSWQNAVSAITSPTIGTNPINSQEDVIPMFWARPASAGGTTGFKGFSSMIKLKSVNRATGDTVSTTTTSSKDYICLGDYMLTWNGSTPSV